MPFARNNRPPASRSIGARLTLLGTGITLLVCLLVCAVLYAGISVALRREVDTFLDGEAGEFLEILNEHGSDIAAVQDVARRELKGRGRHDLSFRVLDERGDPILTSEENDPLPAPMPGMDDLLRKGDRSYATLAVPALNCDVRLYHVRYRTADGRNCVVQVSYTLDQIAASLTTFRRICYAALAAAAILALIGGRVLADRSLRPVGVMTDTARQIGAGPISRRIERTGNGDELDRLAATLNDMLDRIERQVRQMRQFAADASHELRTPLAALRGSAEVALSQPRDAGQLRGVLEDAIHHYDRLIRIAGDLLLLARADAGQPILRAEKIRLDEAIDDVVDLYEPVAADQGVNLRFDPRPATPVVADGARVRQLFGNLIDNALKHTDAPGEVTITLVVNDNAATVRVRDSGAGIPGEDLPHVFDRFYRVDRARTGRGAQGAGLGLAICRSIAEAHGGTIGIESAPGAGTVVTVTLPRGGNET